MEKLNTLFTYCKLQIVLVQRCRHCSPGSHRSGFIIERGCSSAGRSHHFLFCDFLPLSRHTMSPPQSNSLPGLRTPRRALSLYIPPLLYISAGVAGIFPGKASVTSQTGADRKWLSLDSLDRERFNDEERRADAWGQTPSKEVDLGHFFLGIFFIKQLQRSLTHVMQILWSDMHD